MFYNTEIIEAGSTCPACDAVFYPKRKDQKYCSPACRKNTYSRKDRKNNRRNSTNSAAKWRENMELFDRHRCLIELVMKQQDQSRKDRIIAQIIDVAEGGHGQLRTILTSKAFRYPDRYRKYLFFRIHQHCKTIAQMANAYSWKTWGCSLKHSLTYN